MRLPTFEHRTGARNYHGSVERLSVNSGLYGPSGSLSLIDRDRHRMSKRTQYFVGPPGSSGSPGLARSPASSPRSLRFLPRFRRRGEWHEPHEPPYAPRTTSPVNQRRPEACIVGPFRYDQTSPALRSRLLAPHAECAWHDAARSRNTPSLTVQGRERPRT